MSLDDGLTWQGLGSVTVDAPADHGNDGIHWVLSRARDNAGNLSSGPRARRPHRHGGAADRGVGAEERRAPGDAATIRFTLDDRSFRVFCQLVVTADATGKVVARRDLGLRSTWQWWWDWWGDWDGYTYRLKADLEARVVHRRHRRRDARRGRQPLVERRLQPPARSSSDERGLRATFTISLLTPVLDCVFPAMSTAVT